MFGFISRIYDQIEEVGNAKFGKDNCEEVYNVINEVLIPEIYQTYQNNDKHNNLPSYTKNFWKRLFCLKKESATELHNNDYMHCDLSTKKEKKVIYRQRRKKGKYYLSKQV